MAMITQTTQPLAKQRDLRDVTVRETSTNGFSKVHFGKTPEECFEEERQEGMPRVASHMYTQDSELFNIFAEAKDDERRIRIDLQHPEDRGLQIAILVDGIGTEELSVSASSYYLSSDDEYNLSHRYDAGIRCYSSEDAARAVEGLLLNSNSPAIKQYHEAMVQIVEYELEHLAQY